MTRARRQGPEWAIALAESGWWKGLDPIAIVSFQLFEELLCMDFADFHQAVETCLGRPVWTHEFGSRGIEGLRKEFLKEKPAPTFDDILALIPNDKVILFIQGETHGKEKR